MDRAHRAARDGGLNCVMAANHGSRIAGRHRPSIAVGSRAPWSGSRSSRCSSSHISWGTTCCRPTGRPSTSEAGWGLIPSSRRALAVARRHLHAGLRPGADLARRRPERDRRHRRRRGDRHPAPGAGRRPPAGPLRAAGQGLRHRGLPAGGRRGRPDDAHRRALRPGAAGRQLTRRGTATARTVACCCAPAAATRVAARANRGRDERSGRAGARQSDAAAGWWWRSCGRGDAGVGGRAGARGRLRSIPGIAAERSTPTTTGSCRSPSRAARPASSSRRRSAPANAGLNVAVAATRSRRAHGLRLPRRRAVQDHGHGPARALTGDGSAGNPCDAHDQPTHGPPADFASASRRCSPTSTGRRTSASSYTRRRQPTTPVSGRLYEAADLYVAGDDAGVGLPRPRPSAPGRRHQRRPRAARAASSRQTPWSHYQEAYYDTSSASPATATARRPSFTDTIDPALVDNGVGVQWDFAKPGRERPARPSPTTWRFSHFTPLDLTHWPRDAGRPARPRR